MQLSGKRLSGKHFVRETSVQETSVTLYTEFSNPISGYGKNSILTSPTVIHKTAQKSSDIFPLILWTVIIAHTLSIGREGEQNCKEY